MPVGLPQHLMPAAIVRSINRAVIAAALLHIAGAGIAVVVLQVSVPSTVLWPALVPLALIAWLMVRYLRHRTPTNLWLLVLTGVCCAYIFAVIFHAQPDAMTRADGYIIAMPTLALMLAPGVANRPGQPLVATVAAFLGGCLVVTISALQHDVVIVPAVTPIGTLAIVALLNAIAGLRGASWSSARGSLLRAQRDEQLASIRYNIELKAAALIHDTVLNDLAALAAAPAGPLRPALRGNIEHDLALLLGEEWLGEEPDRNDNDPRAEWRQSHLAAAIDAARAAGLRVDLSGDLRMLGRLPREASRALALAVRQCLANVLQHSGIDRAEVAVYGTEADVTVMVVDSGRGFAAEDTAADRMGLRHSVRNRVEQAGGSVRLWSTPGRGTSVLIRLPVGPRDDAAQRLLRREVTAS
jgi:signal transduction histidine kinase